MSSAPPEHVLIIGAMGSGKTTLATALARRLDRVLFDSDADLLAARGIDVATLFAREGREALHEAELEVLEQAVHADTPGVIAVAAGMVDSDKGIEAIASAGLVVYLRATIPTLLARIGDGSGRPIDGDVATALEVLQQSRGARYVALADLVIDIDGLEPGAVLERVLERVWRTVEVPLGDRSYPVLIGPGVRTRLAEVLPPSARRAAIVTQAAIGIEVDTGLEQAVFYIADGESAKSLTTLERLCREFATFGLTRADVIVALGGGVVTDLAGFAASCYHRGTAYVNVSTTLLGQIDAAVGGKTAANLPEGKNLVGAFWQPAAVLCDTDTLVTLPEREWRSGRGEMVKYAFLGVEELDTMRLVDQVVDCVALKADVVREDEREGGRRMLLNYGHTLAHALEAAGFADGPGRDGIDLRHGEAVAIGLVFAARLAEVLGRIDEARVERHLEVLRAYGLPTEIPSGVELEELLVLMRRDKKATSGLTFVLDGPKGVEVVPDVRTSAIELAFERASSPSQVREGQRSHS